MSKDKTYRKLIQSKKWQELRLVKLQNNPTCEMCEANGVVRPARCVHHITPVESATSEARAEELCYSLSNLQSLCFECHSAIHNRERYHSRDAHKQRTEDATTRWLKKHGLT